MKWWLWIYSQAFERADTLGISGVTHSLTQGVVKNIIPAITSTNAIISSACALEALKIAIGCSKSLSTYLNYNGKKVLIQEYMKCQKMKIFWSVALECWMELDSCATLQKFIDLVRKHPRFKFSRPSVMYRGNNFLYSSTSCPRANDKIQSTTSSLWAYGKSSKRLYTFKWYCNY